MVMRLCDGGTRITQDKKHMALMLNECRARETERQKAELADAASEDAASEGASCEDAACEESPPSGDANEAANAPTPVTDPAPAVAGADALISASPELRSQLLGDLRAELLRGLNSEQLRGLLQLAPEPAVRQNKPNMRATRGFKTSAL